MRFVLASALGLLAAPALADLSDNQRQAECSLLEGKVSCPAPGLGRCWAPGHDPNLDQPAQALDVASDPASPDHGHPERCAGYAAPTAMGAAIAAEALGVGKPALPPPPAACVGSRCLIETVEATDVAFAHRAGVLMRAYNQLWTWDPARPMAKSREDVVTWVFCSKTHPAVMEPIRSGEGAGKFALAFLVPEDRNFYNSANALQLTEYFLVCHARRFDALAADAPAFAKAAGYAAALGDAQKVVDRPEDVFAFVN